jgi:hypothetical protein
MAQLLSNFMIDKSWDDKHVISEYSDAFLESRQSEPTTTKGHEVSVISADADLSAITKRSSLIASHLILAHDKEISRRHQFAVIHTQEGDPGESENLEFYEQSRSILCPDYRSVANWIRAAAPLIRSGRSIYFPQLTKTEYQPNADRYNYQDLPLFDETTFTSFDLLSRGDQAIGLVDSPGIASQMMLPLLRLDLPYIEGTSLADFASISIQEETSEAATKDYLRRKLLELLECDSERVLALQSSRVSVEISEGVRELAGSLQRVSRKTAVQAAGGTLATVAATLVAMDMDMVIQFLPVLGLSGGLWGLTSLAAQRQEERDLIKAKPFYFFWLLDRKARAL